jgi:hypothetical protein
MIEVICKYVVEEVGMVVGWGLGVGVGWGRGRGIYYLNLFKISFTPAQ